MSSTLDSVIRRRSDIRFRRVKTEWVVIRQQEAEVLVLNEWAGRILELLDGSRSLRDVVVQLRKQYAAPPDGLENDVISFAAELVDSGLGEQVKENR